MKEKILDVLADVCEEDVVKEHLDIDLVETGLLDSLAFTQLLMEIEDNFGVIIAPSEIERSDMNTPQKVINLVVSRLS